MFLFYKKMSGTDVFKKLNVPAADFPAVKQSFYKGDVPVFLIDQMAPDWKKTEKALTALAPNAEFKPWLDKDQKHLAAQVKKDAYVEAKKKETRKLAATKRANAKIIEKAAKKATKTAEQFEEEEEHGQDVISNFTDLVKPLVSSDQLSKLLKAPLIKSSSPYLLDIYYLIKQAPKAQLAETLKFIQTSTTPETLIFEAPNTQKYKEREQFEIRAMTEKPKVEKGAFKCARCGSEETISSQLQVRSGDEPMTTFVTCDRCSNRWKIN